MQFWLDNAIDSQNDGTPHDRADDHDEQRCCCRRPFVRIHPSLARRAAAQSSAGGCPAGRRGHDLGHLISREGCPPDLRDNNCPSKSVKGRLTSAAGLSQSLLGSAGQASTSKRYAAAPRSTSTASAPGRLDGERTALINHLCGILHERHLILPQDRRKLSNILDKQLADPQFDSNAWEMAPIADLRAKWDALAP